MAYEEVYILLTLHPSSCFILVTAELMWMNCGTDYLRQKYGGKFNFRDVSAQCHWSLSGTDVAFA